jgi:DNA-binding transcriptional LysR family regulator
MLDPRRMEILREVAARGSFSAAAQALWTTQPAVSRQIAALEREAGARLVERRARGVRLTEAGRILVGHAEAIKGHLTAARDALDALEGLRAGRLRLATFPTAGSTLVLEAVTRFHERHPRVELSVAEALAEPSLGRLRAGEVEIAVVFDSGAGAGVDDGIERVHLFTEEMQVGLPRSHRLAGRKRLRLAELADEPWLQGTQGGTSGLVYRACIAAGFEPRITCEADDTLMIGGLVAAGVGLTFVSRLALEHHRSGLAVVPLDDPPSRRVYAALLPGHRAPAVAAMLEFLVAAGARRAATLAA